MPIWDVALRICRKQLTMGGVAREGQRDMMMMMIFSPIKIGFIFTWLIIIFCNISIYVHEPFLFHRKEMAKKFLDN